MKGLTRWSRKKKKRFCQEWCRWMTYAKCCKPTRMISPNFKQTMLPLKLISTKRRKAFRKHQDSLSSSSKQRKTYLQSCRSYNTTLISYKNDSIHLYIFTGVFLKDFSWVLWQSWETFLGTLIIFSLLQVKELLILRYSFWRLVCP